MTTTTKTIEIPCADEYGRVGGDQVIRLMSRMVNSPTATAAEDMAIAFSSEHRTLQQQMLGAMLTCIVSLSADSKVGRTDPRNEFGGKIAEAIHATLIDLGVYVAPSGEVRLPLI